MQRPLCKTCQLRPAGVNYKRNDKIYYRSECDSCIRAGKKIKMPKPNWSTSGYKKKLACDLCGFKSKWGKQILVYYVDGDMNNVKQSNLRSICLNCSVTVEKQDMPWAKDLGLNPDY